METESCLQQETQPMSGVRPGRRFHWRAFVSVATALSFVAMSTTGAVLFVTPPGRIAHWTGWRIWALTKEQWAGLHIWFSLLFMIAVVLHLYLNWRSFLSYFRTRIHRVFALRAEWVTALLLSGVVGWATLAEVKPFSSLLTWNEAIKRSWDTAAAQAPIPHAELMTRWKPSSNWIRRSKGMSAGPTGDYVRRARRCHDQLAVRPRPDRCDGRTERSVPASGRSE